MVKPPFSWFNPAFSDIPQHRKPVLPSGTAFLRRFDAHHRLAPRWWRCIWWHIAPWAAAYDVLCHTCRGCTYMLRTILVYTSVYIYTYLCMYIYILIYVYVCIYIYVYNIAFIFHVNPILTWDMSHHNNSNTPAGGAESPACPRVAEGHALLFRL
jgi:hypothetical protein